MGILPDWFKDKDDDGDKDPLTRVPVKIQVDLQGARQLYGRLRITVQDLMDVIERKIEKNDLTAAQTALYMEKKVAVQALDREVRLALDNPKLELDTERIETIVLYLAEFIGAFK